MKSKKIKKTARILTAAIFLSLLTASFCACTDVRSTEGLFGYQEELSEVTGTWCEGESQRGVCIKFDSSDGTDFGGDDGKMKDRKITFTSPDTVSGISFELRDGVLNALCGDMNIELSENGASSVMRLCRLFELCEEDIESVKAVDEGLTEVYGGKDGISWQVTTDQKGIPTEIRLNDNGRESVISIDGIALKGQ